MTDAIRTHMTLIFQYGSNCLDSEINGKDRLCGDARFIGIAETADDFRLSFDVWSKRRSCAAANIVPHPGSKVWGALYEVPDYLIDRASAQSHDRKSLDAIEGAKYHRDPIRVRLADGQVLTPVTYLVSDPQPDLETSAAYAELIIRGLRERGVSREYIAEIKTIVSENNASIAAQIEDI